MEARKREKEDKEKKREELKKIVEEERMKKKEEKERLKIEKEKVMHLWYMFHVGTAWWLPNLFLSCYLLLVIFH